MRVKTVRFTNADRDEVEVSSDLGDFYLPWPCRTWHRQAILAWLDEGNVIRPFREDADPERLRAGLADEVYSEAARLLDSITARYAIAEQIAWPELEREARRFLLDGSVGTLMGMSLEEEGKSAEELAYAVIHHANRLNKFRGQVALSRDRHLRRIAGAELDELETYRSHEGWPDVPPR